MDPSASTPETAIEAPATDASATPPEAPASSPEAAPNSIAAAFAQAKAELDGQGGDAATAPDGSSSSEPNEASAQKPAPVVPDPAEEAKSYKLQGALQRIHDLDAQGRLDELTPEERGVYDKLRSRLSESLRPELESQINADREREASFKALYLDLLAEKEGDPKAFAERLLEKPRTIEFMQRYAAAHPEITLDTPDAQRMYSGDELQAHVNTARRLAGQENGERWMEAAKAIAEQVGVDPSSILEDGKGPGTIVAALVEAAAEAKAKAIVDGKLPDLVKAERAAALEQATAQFVHEQVRTPASIPGGPRNPDAPRPRDVSKPYSMAEAFAEARAELEKAG